MGIPERNRIAKLHEFANQTSDFSQLAENLFDGSRLVVASLSVKNKNASDSWRLGWAVKTILIELRRFIQLWAWSGVLLAVIRKDFCHRTALKFAL